MPSQLDLNELFTTSGPVRVEKRYQFAGREELLKKAFDDASMPNSAIVIFGERGVGKSSAGWQIFAGLSGNLALFEERSISIRPAINKRFRCIWLTCTEFIESITDLIFALVKDGEKNSLRATFPRIFGDQAELNRLLRTFDLEISSKSIKSRPSAGATSPTETLEPSNEELSAFFTLKELLDRAWKQEPDGTEIVIFLDEFDTVKESARVGILIKALSNVKFVIIGVATSRTNLIGQHPSIARKLSAYEVPLFKSENVEWFFDSLEQKSKASISFSPAFRKLIADKSSGFPYLVQQFGYASAAIALDEKRRILATDKVIVESAHYKAMITPYLNAKLGGELSDINSYSEVARKIIINLARASKGRKSEDDLISGLDSSLRRFFEHGLQELVKGKLVYQAGKEVRITDPLTRVLINVGIEEGQFI